VSGVDCSRIEAEGREPSGFCMEFAFFTGQLALFRYKGG
jgi:hypothetical protein